LALALDVAKTAKLKNPQEDIQSRIEHIREVEKNLILVQMKCSVSIVVCLQKQLKKLLN
jgi:hypothetical protein